MFPIEIQIERAQLTPRKHGQLMKAINRRVMERHIRDRVPNHFEEIAYTEYNARPRAVNYNKLKSKVKKHKKPNVWSGRLRQSVLTRYKITATQYGSALKMRGTVKNRLADWQRKEIAVLSRKEITQERRRQASEYKRGATSDKYRRKRKRRIK